MGGTFPDDSQSDYEDGCKNKGVGTPSYKFDRKS